MEDYKDLDKELFDIKCKKYTYYPIILPAKKRIIAIGDLHGDMDITLRSLKLGKCIDESNNWIGGDTYVVQVGDQLDNCRPAEEKCDYNINLNNEKYDFKEVKDIKVLEYFTKLNEQANKTGGAVISLLGNHEIMNVLGNFNYVSPGDVENFKGYVDPKDKNIQFENGKEARKYAFRPGNEYAKILACTRLPALIIGDFIFVHAGLINKFMEKIKLKNKDELYRLNYSFKKWLLGLVNKDYVVDIINSSQESMFWDRILGSIPPNMNNSNPKCVKHLNKVLEILNVSTMIIGHTPQFFTNHEGINSTCDNKLYRIDFGGSFGFDKFDKDYQEKGTKSKLRKVQVLEITDNKNIKILSE